MLSSTSSPSPTEWSRDHLADANPDLIRKRPRLSEEPSSSPTLPRISIEATKEHDIVDEDANDHSNDVSILDISPELSFRAQVIDLASSTPGIVVTGDEPMSRYNQTLDLIPSSPLPLEGQIDLLCSAVTNRAAIDPGSIIRLSKWLVGHPKINDDALDWSAGDNDDRNVFARLGWLCYRLLQCEEVLFAKEDVSRCGTGRVRNAFLICLKCMTRIATRILTSLPDAVDAALSRRDSVVTGKAVQQHIELLVYVPLLAQIVVGRDARAIPVYEQRLGYSAPQLALDIRDIFHEYTHAPHALTSLFKIASRHHLAIHDPWDALDSIMSLALQCKFENVKEVEHMFAAAHRNLLPVICDKYARGSLPNKFQENFISNAHEMLHQLTRRLDYREIAEVYETYLQDGSDALIVDELMEDNSLANSLRSLSNDNHNILAELVALTWSFKALRSYIYSDIMDVRSSGISLLSGFLIKIWHKHQRVANGRADNPIVLYVARFMRTNELTKYIFGPDSHANLVRHSADIVGFLVSTGAYTNYEIDLMWHACTNSTEAEFAKAAATVLYSSMMYLQGDQLLYIAKKFATTSPSGLGMDAGRHLSTLFEKIRSYTEKSADPAERLATAFVSIDILLRISAEENNRALSGIREVANDELFSFKNAHRTDEERIMIYRRLKSGIDDSAERATRSIMILASYLEDNESRWTKSQSILELFPPDAAVTELIQCIDQHRIRGERSNTFVNDLESRFRLIVRLMALAASEPDKALLDRLGAYIVGEAALDNWAREAGWNMTISFLTRARLTSDKAVGETILSHFLYSNLTSQPLEFVAPTLVKAISEALTQELELDEARSNFHQFLHSPLMKRLVDIGRQSPDFALGDQARKMTSRLIIDHGSKAILDRTVLCESVAEFVREILQDIASRQRESPSSSPSVKADGLLQDICLLEYLLYDSRQRSELQLPISESKVVFSDGGTPESLIKYDLQIFEANDSPRYVEVHAHPSTKLWDLISHLPGLTGANSHLVIVSGKKVFNLCESPHLILTEIDTTSSRKILVCPRHDKNSDLDRIPREAGVVEKEIAPHSAVLASFLDGPMDVATRILNILTLINPPLELRRRILAPSRQRSELFPCANTYRSLYSLHILQTHLADLTRLGVVDEEVTTKAMRLLVTLFTSDDDYAPIVWLTALRCLLSILLGTPTSFSNETPLIEVPASFVDHLVRRTLEALGSSPWDPETCLAWAPMVVAVLLEASRRQPSVWESLTQCSAIYDFYESILINYDVGVAQTTAEVIRPFCISSDRSSRETFALRLFEILSTLIPKAMACKNNVRVFFDLAADLLNACLRSGKLELNTPQIIESLSSQILAYKHSETFEQPGPDLSLLGLASLLMSVIDAVKQKGQSVATSNLSVKLLTKFLFPSLSASSGRQTSLLCGASRKLIYDLIYLTCDPTDELVAIASMSHSAVANDQTCSMVNYPGHSLWLRPTATRLCCGLTNLGMTCYMNSLLQQLFANVRFRHFIFQVPIVRNGKQRVLAELQKLFAMMQDSLTIVEDTMPLARALNISIESQEDVHGFFEDFLAQLETDMPNDSARQHFMSFFTGKLITQTRGECGHVSPREEPFVDLPIVVKDKASLQESLDEFVQGEPLEGANRYKCLSCDSKDGGRLVNAQRRSCPHHIPDNLTFCLKRFTYEAMFGLNNKVNDRFEFPQEIDMSQYRKVALEEAAGALEKDVFELVGVIVHQGTLQMGHYWSYTLVRNTRVWVKLEDRNVTTCQGGIDEVLQECRGGRIGLTSNERVDSAYVLFYERVKNTTSSTSTPEASSPDKTASLNNASSPAVSLSSSLTLPPRVPIPEAYENTIATDNATRYRIMHLHHTHFHGFVAWTLMHAQKLISGTAETSSADASEESDQAGVAHILKDPGDAARAAGNFALVYVMRVGVRDDTANAPQFCACLDNLLMLASAEPQLADTFLQIMCEEEGWLPMVYQNDAPLVRKQVSEFVLGCLSILKEQSERNSAWTGLYSAALDDVLRQMTVALWSEAFSVKLHWPDALCFIAALAELGPAEMGKALDLKILVWALEVLYSPWDIFPQKQHPYWANVVKGSPPSVVALYDFLHRILSSEYVDFGDTSRYSPSRGPRRRSRFGSVTLQLQEIHALTLSPPAQRVCFWWMRASTLVGKPCDLLAFPPGKLLRLLLSPKAPVETRRYMEDSLLTYIDSEEDSLPSVLSLVASFCFANAEIAARTIESHVVTDAHAATERIFGAMSRTIHTWEQSEREFLAFAQHVCAYAPTAVVRSVSLWAYKFLEESKSSAVREEVAAWLTKNLFRPSPFLPVEPNLPNNYPGLPTATALARNLDAMRAFQTRKLSESIVMYFNNNEELWARAPSRLQNMVNILQDAEVYLVQLQQGAKMLNEQAEEARERLEDLQRDGNERDTDDEARLASAAQAASLPTNLRTEVDESRSTLQMLMRLFTKVRHLTGGDADGFHSRSPNRQLQRNLARSALSVDGMQPRAKHTLRLSNPNRAGHSAIPSPSPLAKPNAPASGKSSLLFRRDSSGLIELVESDNDGEHADDDDDDDDDDDASSSDGGSEGNGELLVFEDTGKNVPVAAQGQGPRFVHPFRGPTSSEEKESRGASMMAEEKEEEEDEEDDVASDEAVGGHEESDSDTEFEN